MSAPRDSREIVDGVGPGVRWAKAFARHALRQEAFVQDLHGWRGEDGVRTAAAARSLDGSHAIIAFGPAFRPRATPPAGAE